MTRLRQGGARGFGLTSASTGLARHLHPEEACLICTVPLNFIFNMDHRAALCLLGQIAAPVQVVWIQAQFLQAMSLIGGKEIKVDPHECVLHFQQMLLKQVRQRWVTARMYLPRTLSIVQDDQVREILVNQPLRARDLLHAERQLQGWGQYPILQQGADRVPLDSLLQVDQLYELELRTPKQLRPCPIPQTGRALGCTATAVHRALHHVRVIDCT